MVEPAFELEERPDEEEAAVAVNIARLDQFDRAVYPPLSARMGMDASQVEK